jgi:hypothetical protein
VRLAGAVLLGLLVVVTLSSPASAHAADAPSATDYRTTLAKVSPAAAGVRIRVVENGARLELRNNTRQTVLVLGYSGEPYLRVTPEGVWTNERSPATWVNQTIDGKVTPPANAGIDTKATPRWTKVSSQPVVRWHDHRTHWMSPSLPPAVAAAPNVPRLLANWQVGLVVGTAPVTISGRLDYLPPPSAGAWWGLSVLAAAALVGLALLRPLRRVLPLVLSAALLVAAAAELVDAVGRALDDGQTGFGVLRWLLFHRAYGLATVVGAVAAAAVALRRRPSGLFALALAGACLAAVGGLADVAVFGHAVAPVAWSGTVARLCTAAGLGLGGGVALAAALRLRQEASAARPPRTSARAALRDLETA